MSKKLNFKKFEPYDSLNDLKVVKNYINPAIIFFVVIIIYISAIISYLNKLKECSCYVDKNNNASSELTYLTVIESVILSINLILLLFILFMKSKINNLTYGGGNNDTKNNLLEYYICAFVLFVIYFYFIYYVYKLHRNVDDKCECSKNWLRYLLYFQVLLMICQIGFILYSCI